MNRLPFNARSAKIGYLVLNIPTLFMLLLYISLIFKDGPLDPSIYGVFVLLTIYGLTWVFWLKGFKIAIDSDQFYYRDGLHRSHSIRLSDIKKTEFKWVDWRVLTRVIKIPRLIIHSKEGEKPIWINIKPFAKDDLKELREILDKFPLE